MDKTGCETPLNYSFCQQFYNIITVTNIFCLLLLCTRSDSPKMSEIY